MNILCIVDNKNWCWTTTAKEIAAKLPQHTFTLVTTKQFQTSGISGDSFDLLWCRGYPSIVQGLTPREKPWVATVATGGTRLERRLLENDIQFQSRTLAGIITQCSLARNALDAKNIKTWLIPNGVDQEKFYPNVLGLPDGEPIVGMAANVEDPERAEMKGVPYVEQACKELKIKFEIVQDLPQDELANWYRRLTIYCQPSKAEGCSNSVMEAMACGVPCLVTQGVGYHGEVCQHEENVYFVKRNAESIKKSISKLLERRKMLIKIRQGALDFIRCHTWESIAARYNEVFEIAAAFPIPKEPREHVGIVVSAKVDVSVSDICRKRGELFMVTRAEYLANQQFLDVVSG